MTVLEWVDALFAVYLYVLTYRKIPHCLHTYYPAGC